jgi:hypothetical protein
MDKEPILDLLQATAGTQRLPSRHVLSESNRHRWEQQWLRENGAVSGVVDNGARGATTLGTSVDDAAGSAATGREAGMNTRLAASPRLVAAATGRAATPASLDAAARPSATRPDARLAALQPPWQPASPPHVAEQPMQAAATALAARHRSALKQFAMWRDDDEVRVALRVDESLQHSEQTWDALRQWLKDLRLKLTSLTVNGSVRWQARQPDDDGYY